ncbi:YkyA family protein [Pullulanibacillus sp. KACC 23026]|uniref:YkyA family protein n=1 Tax=Pullulanibacillus sp. KACC 23026 TaxID=3028315 RepID=UPI0023B1FD89|nr:YkyA family protein [Pullulanibacillus sp. KACC 23026]WEG11752.1 YkyA family protein [Pullulanibacillus sp. KACC 23026]
MIHRIKTFSLFLPLIGLLFIGGCSKQASPAEQAYTDMEKAAHEEKTFNDQQKPLIQEEQKEQNLYNEIMALDMKHFDQISAKSEEALKSIKKRRTLIMKEKESIDQAEKVFEKAVPLLKEVKTGKSATYAKALINDMSNRKSAFQTLYKDYSDSLDQETALFNLLKTKNLTVEKLQAQLDKVNNSYKKINTDKDKFNNSTNQFNQDKKNFYKSMNIMGKHSG